jgi:Polyketide cyclase / dehydrase and lipid transport
MYEFEVSARSTAPVEAVWSVLVDSLHWPEWTNLPTPTMERQGNPPPFGLGAVRRFNWGPVYAREEVVQWDPPHRWAYSVAGGMPIRGYRADVVLTEIDSGTLIEWRGRFVRATWPGMSRPLRFFTRTMLQKYATNLGLHAQRASDVRKGSQSV